MYLTIDYKLNRYEGFKLTGKICILDIFHDQIYSLSNMGI